MNKLVLLVLLVVLGVVVLVSCSQNSPVAPNTNGWTQMDDGTYYRLFYLEGMPCFQISPGAVDSFSGGFTCDWSKWNGN